jgi:ferrochelatase
MDSPSDARPPTGLLCVNLGSPAAPTPAAVRAFLDEFLGDPLVVDANRLLWWGLRKLVILPLRAPRSARAYARVWSGEGAPLLANARRFAAALERELGPSFRVALAMRYGAPSIAAGVGALLGAGCRRIVLLPAFPQASRTTSGTIEREARRVLAAHGGTALAVVPAHPDEPGYVAALAARVRARGAEPDHHVFSFHGLPVRLVQAGDPYRDHCERTARALARALGLPEQRWTLAYQSRFGREPWLEPDAAALVPALAAGGRRVRVTTPGFTADCLETLEELGLRLAAACAARGGELELVPCLNDDPAWVRAAAGLVRAAAGR